MTNLCLLLCFFLKWLRASFEISKGLEAGHKIHICYDDIFTDMQKDGLKKLVLLTMYREHIIVPSQ